METNVTTTRPKRERPKAILFLIGTELDFETTKLGSRFTFKNPNQTSACGCGESVSITPADAH